MWNVWAEPERMLCWLARSYPLRRIRRLRSGRSPVFRGQPMLAKVKFCGMTRPVDAALAAEIGATYVGVVFADGPRRVTPSQARAILDSAGTMVKRAGVFGTNSPEEIARVSEEARLDIVQLHADPTTADVRAVRKHFNGEVWAAIRISGSHIPRDAELLFDSADAVVLDARSEKRLGGTGEALPWNDLAVD